MMSEEKSNWDRVEPPKLLSRARVTQLLDPWLAGREVLEVALMSGGLMNRNFHLRLSGRPSECVLRIYDRDPSSCAREVAVLGMIGRDIPVPRVLFADESGENGPPLCVMSLVPGISLFTLRTMEDEASLGAAAHAVGRLLPAIGRFPGPRTPFVTTRELVETFTESSALRQRVPADLVAGVRALSARWESRLAEVSGVSGLVHCDFNSRNIFVTRDGDDWRVSGVLDWEFAIDASPLVDVGNFLRYEHPDRPRLEPHFSRGLRDAGMELPADWLMLARVMDLPALCELLTRPRVPDTVAAEIVGLMERTMTLLSS
jgi:aminoglycoside phosphotransferase (APT) family kinase protein